MRVAVAMSGGVDSSVAAYELKKKGYEVVGMTIKTWPKEECGGDFGAKACCSLDAVQLARSVAEDIGIPHYVIDLSKEFAEEVKAYFIEEYTRGRTPSPCIYCNSRIKFGYLFNRARQVGAEKIATGHFARIIEKDGNFYLAEGADKKKDQSYFLYAVPAELMSSIEFPLGDHTKEEVRRIAAAEGFLTAEEPSSQDVCFGGPDGDYRSYLKKSGVDVFNPGDILDAAGNTVGRHRGIASYTVGQRHGMGLEAMDGPVYVTGIDAENNTVTVGTRDETMKDRIRVMSFNWLSIKALDRPTEFDVKLRYAGKKARALVTPSGSDGAVVEFEERQFAPTPGQAAVFYDGEIVAGGGWIEDVLG